MAILLYGNHPHMAEYLKRSLEQQGLSVYLVFDAQNAITLAKNRVYNLVLIDLEAPHQDNLEPLQALYGRASDPPVLFLVRPGMLEAVVGQVHVTQAHYLVKPFRLSKLMGRIRSLIQQAPMPREQIDFADLRFEPSTRKVWRQHQQIVLTRKEAALLGYFLQHPNQVLSRRRIAENVWEEPFALDTFTNIIDVYVNYLRKKIDRDFEPKLIHTVRGQGYMLKDPQGDGARCEHLTNHR